MRRRIWPGDTTYTSLEGMSFETWLSLARQNLSTAFRCNKAALQRNPDRAPGIPRDMRRLCQQRRFDHLPAELEFDLQRFAAEDEGRTEAPTERRQREERDKGNVPKSSDLTGATVFLGAVIVLFLSGSYIFNGIMDVFRFYLSEDFNSIVNLNIEDIKRIGFELFMHIAWIITPVMTVSVIMAVAGNVSQFGLLFSLQAIQFKPERIMPDFKRVLPVRRNIVNLLKIIIQVLIVGSAAWLIISQDYLPMLKAANLSLQQAIVLFAWTAMKLMLITGLVLFLIAIPDLVYQRFEYMENLKMSVAETKQERKEEEGDPLLRQRQRERGQELMRSQRNMLASAATADVVITNPTHFAIALRYDRESAGVDAPVVVAKGTDHMAFTIRQIAKKNNVHIEENPPLARVLYNRLDIGDQIPVDLYQAISIIFSKLNRFRQPA
ncbi:MAG: EscU/YscU/HrcU family type III secretion system export apparatus switch protein [Leptospiraceae bacterium]|nr:EscU/YscU/HrcU family type III secretion system export apparatus switch protein [Leptospiraceae bacterium]